MNINKNSFLKTAEELMRSRYEAYKTSNFEYLKQTLHPDKQNEFDEAALREQSKQIIWEKLEVKQTKDGKENDLTGEVVFIAWYRLKNELQLRKHHEHSFFEKIEGNWYFVHGELK